MKINFKLACFWVILSAMPMLSHAASEKDCDDAGVTGYIQIVELGGDLSHDGTIKDPLSFSAVLQMSNGDWVDLHNDPKARLDVSSGEELFNFLKNASYSGDAVTVYCRKEGNLKNIITDAWILYRDRD